MTLNNQTSTVTANPAAIQSDATANPATIQTEAMQAAWLYSTVYQFNKKYPAFPVGTLRHQIFNEETNGLKESGAIVRNGRRVLIRDDRYFAWLESQNGGATA